jgi:hypothetical protein
MRRRNEIGSIASGILYSFVSRNNDLDGYWGIGVLYLYAQQVGELTVTVDILGNLVNPQVTRLLRIYRQPNFEVLIDRYRSMLFTLLDKRGLPRTWVTDAVFSIEFKSKAAVPAYPKIGENSEAFACTLSMKDDLGRGHVFHTAGWCWPHNPWREMRSTRV